jgi:hypothetical protein
MAVLFFSMGGSPLHLSEFVGCSVSKMECKAELSGGVRSPIAKRGLWSWAKLAQFTPEANQPGGAEFGSQRWR